MKKFPKPWYRPSRGVWYVTLHGQQINLGPDKAAALAQYKQLLAKPARKRVAGDSVVALVDAFLSWCQKDRSSATYEWYRWRLERFCRRFPDLRAADLKPLHVQEWVDATSWEDGGRRNGMRAIQRAMKWAEEQGYIERSPIAHIRKPPRRRREVVIPPADFEEMLSLTKGREFRDLVTFAWETGARAEECLAVEARHFEAGNFRVVFPIDEEKMHRAPRVIYLNETALEIVSRLVKKHPAGAIFRNADGLAWTTDATNCRFQRLKEKIGKKYCLTHFRHSFATRLLADGVDALTVSILLGHSDPSMVARVYGHLNHAPKFLLDVVRRAAG